MLNIAIWETDSVSLQLKEIIETDYNKAVAAIGADTLSVSGYVKADGNANMSSNYEVFSIRDFIHSYQNHEINALIIPIDLFNGNNGLILLLLECGINIQDIYLFDRLKNYSPENVLDSITPYISKGYLPYLEFHLADHCNLNCKACEHYSSLVKEPVFPDFSEFKQGLSSLKTYIEDIGTIRLLGGEPLLNPDIIDYIEYTRTLYPISDIYIVTNGSLLMRMPESFYTAVKKYRITISITQYKPFLEIMPELKQYLDSQAVTYEISTPINYFGIRQKLEKSNTPKYFYRCLSARCNFLYGTKIGACYMPFLTKYFNQYFEKELAEPLPEDGSIDLLAPNLSTELLKIQLLMPFERCKYCTDGQRTDWEIIGKNSCLGDWIIH